MHNHYNENDNVRKILKMYGCLKENAFLRRRTFLNGIYEDITVLNLVILS